MVPLDKTMTSSYNCQY